MSGRAILAAVAGLAGLAILAAPGEQPAAPLGLIGYCNGELLHAEEESAFPASGCAWIQRVATIEDGGQAWRKAEGGRSIKLTEEESK